MRQRIPGCLYGMYQAVDTGEGKTIIVTYAKLERIDFMVKDVEERIKELISQHEQHRGSCYSEEEKHMFKQGYLVANMDAELDTESDEDLIPCPFCGYKAVLEPIKAQKGYEAVARCNGCLASLHTITYETEEEAISGAITLWNKRV